MQMNRILIMMALSLTMLTTTLTMLTTTSYAVTVFESASLGQIGLPIQQLLSGSVPGVNVLPQVFTGVRFELTQSTRVTAIGGHFVANTIDGGEGSVFGTVVALDGPSDFPDSANLSTADVLGDTLITLPLFSADVSGELPLVLDPGWYALVFGSELFESDGFGVVVGNGLDVGNPSYIGGQSNTIGFWRELPPLFTNQRFFVEGQVIPEPPGIALLLCCVPLLAIRRHAGRDV